MTAVHVDDAVTVATVLVAAADDFAVRALAAEARRDQARPGTSSHHLHAHSATLWRQAESRLRALLHELDPSTAPPLHRESP